MTLEDLGNIGDFLGAIGVIVTLVYLAIQIRQNSRMIKDNTIATLMTHSAEANRMPQPDWYYPLWEKIQQGADLSKEEEAMASISMYGMITTHDAAYYQYYRGNLAEEAYSAFRGRLETLARLPYFRSFWTHGSESFSEPFRKHVDELLKSDPTGW